MVQFETMVPETSNFMSKIHLKKYLISHIIHIKNVRCRKGFLFQLVNMFVTREQIFRLSQNKSFIMTNLEKYVGEKYIKIF